MSADDCIVDLAESFVAAHPAAAARFLESLSGDQVSAFLTLAKAEAAASALANMPLATASHHLRGLPPATAAILLAQLGPDLAGDLLRALETPEREPILSAMPEPLSQQLAQRLAYPASTTGAIMRHGPPSVPVDVTLQRAVDHLHHQDATGIPYVYVVDREGQLVGVIDLADLLTADPATRVADLAGPVDVRLLTSTPLAAAFDHPGWRRFSILPVVDDGGRLVGTIKYRTLQSHWQPAAAADATSAGVALGELYHLGITGLLQVAASRSGTEKRLPGTGDER